MNNFFSDIGTPSPDGQERFDPLLTNEQGLLVERIVSHGNVTPEGQWHDQELDEWVLILTGNARVSYADGTEVSLQTGDCLLIPRRVRHRVSFTSSPCVWLAVHGNGLKKSKGLLRSI